MNLSFLLFPSYGIINNGYTVSHFMLMYYYLEISSTVSRGTLNASHCAASRRGPLHHFDSNFYPVRDARKVTICRPRKLERRKNGRLRPATFFHQ